MLFILKYLQLWQMIIFYNGNMQLYGQSDFNKRFNLIGQNFMGIQHASQ